MARAADSGRQRPGLSVALWLAALVAVTAIWVSGVLVPYYVNDLDQRPLDEVASGAHDPKGLWPYSGGSPAVGLLRGLLLLVALPLMPLLGLGSILSGAVILVSSRDTLTRSTRAMVVAVLAVALLMTGLSLSPLGLALGTWALD
jgi:hypothetical protein